MTKRSLDEYQALLILYENDELISIPLFQYCNAYTSKQAANKLHVDIRRELNTKDTFYICVVDESEMKSKHYECSLKDIDSKILLKDFLANKTKKYEVKKVTEEEILESFASSDNIFKLPNESIENSIEKLIEKNKQKLIPLIKN